MTDARPRPGYDTAHVLFVTGKLAESALRRTLAEMAPPFAFDVAVLRITVAALMTTEWIAQRLEIPTGVDLVLIPGLCEGSLGALEGRLGVRVERGPKDLREIPEFFGRVARIGDYGKWDIEIIAEINNVPRLPRDQVFEQAERFRAAGADVIDVGCTPGLDFPHLADVVRQLRAVGCRVSIDSHDPDEILRAVDAGAELVLSINGTNIQTARTVAGAARVVVVPEGGDLNTIAPLLEQLDRWGVSFLIDPVIEPIGFGFTASLERYIAARRRWPDAAMMMGIGNITELTEADTTGVNALLVAICEELKIHAVLTTEVIPWARGAVREIDIARRLMYYSLAHGVLPKHLDDRLVTTRDPRLFPPSEEDLRELQRAITDPNFRIFVDNRTITVLNRDVFVRDDDIQRIFDRLGVTDPSHAFYLGRELSRAQLALQLGKNYRQEGALRWGYLTPPDDPRRAHVRFTRDAPPPGKDVI